MVHYIMQKLNVFILISCLFSEYSVCASPCDWIISPVFFLVNFSLPVYYFTEKKNTICLTSNVFLLKCTTFFSSLHLHFNPLWSKYPGNIYCVLLGFVLQKYLQKMFCFFYSCTSYHHTASNVNLDDTFECFLRALSWLFLSNKTNS